ncbi:MAG: hypothetical protein K2Q25_02380 [Mycobacteriaceae bacterium]|nr:hypothetical protein [Mycobacteriaceae bacterium]
MAVARSSVSFKPDLEADYREIEDWYRDTLRRVTPPKGLVWEPVKIGPTWQWTEKRGWLLPEASLGWRRLAWCGKWLQDADRRPWQFTPEQARFILWYDSLDEIGRWLYHSAVFQRLKGHGKDPMLACISASACFGPVKFSHWDGDVPVGTEDPVAWVQLVAVAQDQTKNTMKLFPSLFTEECMRRYGIQVQRLNVWGLGDTVQIEAITSNPLTVEGGRPTQTAKNETQNWNSSNQGHEMAGAMEGNAAKSAYGVARSLDVCNAFRPGDDSVAERTREAWETALNAGINIGVLYDSLEAPPDAPLTLADAPAVVRSIAGDSTWLDTAPDGRIVKSIANTANPPSESRRKWYNQITATADAWMTSQWFDPCYRDEPVADGDDVVLFFDGSKSDDHTALVGCRISDGMVFPVGIWMPRKIKAGGADTVIPVDRELVDKRVDEAMQTWDVHGLWADVYGARDDDTGERYWEPYADRWANKYRRKLSRLPAVKTGIKQHLVNWQMTDTGPHLQQFTEACERTLSDVRDGLLFHNCPPPSVKAGLGATMRQHVLNARRRPNKFGIGIGKEHRESSKKIDAAVCMVGARMMWHQLNGQPKKGRAPGRGRIVVH